MAEIVSLKTGKPAGDIIDYVIMLHGHGSWREANEKAWDMIRTLTNDCGHSAGPYACVPAERPETPGEMLEGPKLLPAPWHDEPPPAAVGEVKSTHAQHITEVGTLLPPSDDPA